MKEPFAHDLGAFIAAKASLNKFLFEAVLKRLAE
jgi:hypothetical protein